MRLPPSLRRRPIPRLSTRVASGVIPTRNVWMWARCSGYHAATIFSASVSRGEAALLEGEAVSTYATARVTHDFGSLASGRACATVKSRMYRARSAGSRARSTTIARSASSRKSNRAIPSLRTRHSPKTLVRVSASSTAPARCDVASLGYSAQFTLGRPRWSLYAAARGYDYAGLRMRTGERRSAGTRATRSWSWPWRALGRRLAAGALQRVSGFASRLMPRESTLLESSVSLGAMMPFDERWYGGARAVPRCGEARLHRLCHRAGVRGQCA